VKHIQRANYQAGIWRKCLKQDSQVPSPVDREWNIEKDEVEQLVVHWMDGQPTPKAILDLLASNCPRKSKLAKCVCMVNGLHVYQYVQIAKL